MECININSAKCITMEVFSCTRIMCLYLEYGYKSHAICHIMAKFYDEISHIPHSSKDKYGFIVDKFDIP